jgi:hypothetical protein
MDASKRLRVLLDVDGVLADFAWSVAHFYNRLDIIDNWPPGVKSFTKILGLKYEHFKSDLNTEEFWSTIQPTKDAVDIIGITAPDDVIIVTAVDSMGEIALLWRNRFLKTYFPMFPVVYTEHKHLLANERTVLIDDFEENVDRFREHGGKGIVYPRPWNRHYNCSEPVYYTSALLKAYRRELCM